MRTTWRGSPDLYPEPSSRRSRGQRPRLSRHRRIRNSSSRRRRQPFPILSRTRRGLHSAELAGLLVVAREPGCKLAVSVLNRPDPEAGPKRRPLYGPIPWSCWFPASRLPGKSLQVGAVCWLLAGWSRSAEFEPALYDRAEFGLSRYSASRGLDTLDQAGLVSIARRPGLSPVATILDRTVETLDVRGRGCREFDSEFGRSCYSARR